MRLDSNDFKHLTGNFYNEIDTDWSIDYFGHKPGMHFEHISTVENGAFIDLNNTHRARMHARLLPDNFDLKTWVQGQKGIRLVVLEAPIKDLPDEILQFIVPDTWEFYKEVAGYIRQRFVGSMITVTGSVGKTTTRLMVAQLIKASNHEVITNLGNENARHVLPHLLTSLLKVPDAMVAELSIGTLNTVDANNGPISTLFNADTAVITQIGGAHAGQRTNISDPQLDVARRKAHIFMNMNPNGQAILNYDMEPRIFKYLQQVASKKVAHVYTFSQKDQHADAYVMEQTEYRKYSEVKIRVLDEIKTVKMTIPGDGSVIDLLAACLAYKAQGLKLPDLTMAFSKFKPLNRELTFHNLKTPTGQVTLVDDTYNSTKYSVENVLSIFKKKGKFYKGLKVLVLETGDDITEKQAEQLNLSYQDKILESEIDIVIGYRDRTIKPLIDSLNGKISEAIYYPDMKSIEKYIENLPTDSLIIVKGQHWKYGSDLWKLTPKLLKQPAKTIS